MRVIIDSKVQKELIEKAKRDNNFTWKQLASLLDVGEHTLQIEWRYNKCSLPHKAFKKLLQLTKLKYTVKIKLKDDNWGQRLGAINANKKREYKKFKPIRDDKLAELIGIILGDGNILSDKKNGIYCLRIFFDSEKEVRYLNYVKSLIEDIFETIPKTRKTKGKNCFYLVLQSKGIVVYLESEKLKSGDKIKNKLTIPKWIWERKNYLKSCIRGLIDTDGSIYRLKPQWSNIIQLSFKNNNKELLKDIRSAFIELGFHPSKIFGNRIVITRQEEIKRYLKDVGTNNKIIAPSSSGQEFLLE
ncbi:hypothetical protein A3K64_00380 [Candidatus Micrarchaeota archaeon RBG_16_36_9]|nr:MAG: hypothetical protein A3K64_00380 [Candidatus Micrarchaeota archaeon RBG_16_36_9]